MSDETKLHAVIEMLTTGHVELRNDMKELRDSVNTLVVTHTEAITEQRSTNKELAVLREEIYQKEGGILTRIGTLEIAQSNDKLRWGLVAAVMTMAITGGAGFWALVVKPFQDAQVSNAKVAEKLDSQNQNLDDIFELLAEEYQKREAAGLYDNKN